MYSERICIVGPRKSRLLRMIENKYPLAKSNEEILSSFKHHLEVLAQSDLNQKQRPNMIRESTYLKLCTFIGNFLPDLELKPLHLGLFSGYSHSNPNLSLRFQLLDNVRLTLSGSNISAETVDTGLSQSSKRSQPHTAASDCSEDECKTSHVLSTPVNDDQGDLEEVLKGDSYSTKDEDSFDTEREASSEGSEYPKLEETYALGKDDLLCVFSDKAELRKAASSKLGKSLIKSLISPDRNKGSEGRNYADLMKLLAMFKSQFLGIDENGSSRHSSTFPRFKVNMNRYTPTPLSNAKLNQLFNKPPLHWVVYLAMTKEGASNDMLEKIFIEDIDIYYLYQDLLDKKVVAPTFNMAS